MKGLTYQLKNIRRDKLCILTFLLPILVGLGIRLLSDISLSSVQENSFGVIKNNLSTETTVWLEGFGNVAEYETKEELEEAIRDPSTQMIGVLGDDKGIRTLRSGDEFQMFAVIADTLPQLYTERALVSSYETVILPQKNNHDILKPLFYAITMVTAMFMGCTFTAMSIISEKEDGILWINEILPMIKAQYIIQKMALGFTGGLISTAVTAMICIRIEWEQLLPLALLIILSAFLAALTGIFIGRFSNGLMEGIVSIKLVMLLFLAPPIACYLLAPPGGLWHTLSYLLPSSATFYGLMDLLNGQPYNLGICLLVLIVHCIFGLFLFILLQAHHK